MEQVGNAMTANYGDETDDGEERCPDCGTTDYRALTYQCDCQRCEGCCDCTEED